MRYVVQTVMTILNDIFFFSSFLFCFPSSVILREMNGDNWFFFSIAHAIQNEQIKSTAFICIPIDGWTMRVIVRVQEIRNDL